MTSAMVFIPKWDGAEGFSAGGKYVISSGELFGEDGPAFADGDQLIGLPEDGQPAVVFSIVGASLKSSHVEVIAVERGGQKFMGEDVTIWVVRGAHRGQPVDAGRVRLMLTGQRPPPSGEGEHALSVALDLNSDGKPDTRSSRTTKAEAAPYPITEAQRAAWEAEHGETDWDLVQTSTPSTTESGPRVSERHPHSAVHSLQAGDCNASIDHPDIRSGQHAGAVHPPGAPARCRR